MKSLTVFFISLLPFTVTAQQTTEPDFTVLRQQYSQPAAMWPKPHLAQGVIHRELGLLPLPEFPADNPLTASKLKLGEKLFHDPRLSRSGQIACASCHDQDLGWADGKRVSFGHDRAKGQRNAPSVENSAYLTSFFWDGRASSLEQQALVPIETMAEMNFTLPELIERLSQSYDYPPLFRQAFNSEKISSEHIGMALATYQRTLISRLSAFDRFLQASTEQEPRRRQLYAGQLSNQALWGLHLFRTKARCLNCHNGPEMTDHQFHNIGLTYYKRKYEDLGRFTVTKKAEDVGKFKTPGLRGVMNTKPWMHNGLFSDMEGIINIYNAGGVPQKKDPNDPLSPQTSELLQPLQLNNAEISALLAFMEAITAHPAQEPSVFILQKHHIERDRTER